MARTKESVAAIDESYRCLAKTKEEGIAACQNALTLGLAPWRAEIIRQALAVKLINLVRLGEAVDVYRESARLLPKDAAAQLRFGSALLYFAADAAASEAPLRQALRLDPQNAAAQATLAMALFALGRLGEARGAFDEAARLDPSYFEGRPGARQAYQAAQRGESWP
jgi:cytochrome c-type biogenesis protein CcmH/NrfG